MPSFADALRVLNDMKGSGVVEEYAVAGAMAMIFWAEPMVALYLEPGARTLKRRERAAALMESSAFDRAALDELLERFGLEL